MNNLNITDIPFEKLFSDTPIDLVNKGRIGQLLEILIGLPNSNTLTDFEDGELKTNKSLSINGLPDQTMFITQISSQIDELLNRTSFEQSKLFQKINRLIYLPVVKIGEPKNWFFKTPIFFELKRGDPFYLQLEKDYYSIIDQLHNEIAVNGRIKTANGWYIQIRTKDSQPYKEIYSKLYNTEVSHCNYAFYFKKEFMKDLLRASPDYPEIF